MVVVAEYGRDFRDEFKDVGIYSTAANLTTLDLAVRFLPSPLVDLMLIPSF